MTSATLLKPRGSRPPACRQRHQERTRADKTGRVDPVVTAISGIGESRSGPESARWRDAITLSRRSTVRGRSASQRDPPPIVPAASRSWSPIPVGASPLTCSRRSSIRSSPRNPPGLGLGSRSAIESSRSTGAPSTSVPSREKGRSSSSAFRQQRVSRDHRRMPATPACADGLDSRAVMISSRASQGNRT